MFDLIKATDSALQAYLGAGGCENLAFKSAFLADCCGSVANDRFSFIWRKFAHLYDDIFIHLAS